MYSDNCTLPLPGVEFNGCDILTRDMGFRNHIPMWLKNESFQGVKMFNYIIFTYVYYKITDHACVLRKGCSNQSLT